ncbi:MAG: hypothetical protein WBE80_18250 [Methylocella sp.]
MWTCELLVPARPIANRRAPVGHSPAAARKQGIGRNGNRRGAGGMEERACPWPRGQPGSTLSAGFRERIGKAGGRIKKIMIVALRRKLLIALWRSAEDGVIPEGASCAKQDLATF